MRQPQTQFGKDVRIFAVISGLNLKEIARRADVNYNTFLDVMKGRSVGVEIKPRVLQFMADFEKEGTQCLS